MPLTPQDVRNKLFTPVRFKPGYDEDEVDAFLDEVETELTRLYAQIEQLTDAPRGGASHDVARIQADADDRVRAAVAESEQRSRAQIASLRAEADAQLASLRSAPAAAAAGQPAADAGAAQRLAATEAQAAQLQSQLQQTQAQHAQQLQQLQAQHGQQLQTAQQRAASAERDLAAQKAAPAAAQTGQLAPLGSDGLPVQLPPPSPSEELLRRTLILAQRTADEAVSEARAEAERLVGMAKAEADRTSRTAAAEHAERTRRREAEHQEAVRRGQAENDVLMGKLEELRSFERDYRSRLRAYLHLQLRDLEAGAPKAAPSALAGERTAIGTGEGQTPAAESPGELQGAAPDGPPAAAAGSEAAPAANGQGGAGAAAPTGVLDHGAGGDRLRPAPLYGATEVRER